VYAMINCNVYDQSIEVFPLITVHIFAEFVILFYSLVETLIKKTQNSRDFSFAELRSRIPQTTSTNMSRKLVPCLAMVL
jgi:hypothetical protein